MATAPTENTWRHGVFLRYTNVENWLMAVAVSGLVPGGSAFQTALMVLKRVGGGAPVVLGEALCLFPEVGATEKARIQLMAEASGNWQAWCYPASVVEPSPMLSGNHPDLAEGSGKSVAKGKIGIYDVETSGTERNRDYDDFVASELTPAGVVCYSSRTAEWRSDGFLRQDSSGTYYGTPTVYRGGNLYLPHAGPDVALSRLVIAMRRGDIDLETDANVTDKHAAEVKVRERFLVPR
jgi:hypothetical protein